MKIVVNACYGGFSVSDALLTQWQKNHPHDWELSCYRADPEFVAMVERMGMNANGEFADLEVITLPDNTTDWTIVKSNGYEQVFYVVDGKIFSK